MTANIGVIGGSGLYGIEGAKLIGEIDIPTPFGMPSDVISIIDMNGQKTAFLPRHGRGHRLLPTEVPSKANIWALKYLGVEQIVSVSAVGSLIEEYKPGDFVVCDQLIDRTKSRTNSYFGEGIVGHAEFAEPFCPGMREAVLKVLSRYKHPYHKKGTLVTMEGPLFSTRAESELHRSWKAHLIGMTALPEAKLAREAEICYATIAMVTDYDCWRKNEESVSVEMVIKVMENNVKAAKKILPDIIDTLKSRKDCSCRHAAENAVMTDPLKIPYETRRKLSLFYGKYWK
ncbi:MAG: S-methyl-5'-thioadenosine phosphorylase [Spirochaetes bacterium]|nr:S-methyl-5'-thioadenosine phosphorylase [Spirochaetota bacterium]